MLVKVTRTTPKAILPTKGSLGAGCFDVYSTNDGPVVVSKEFPVILGTGLSFEVPEGFVMLVFSRSGHAFKNNVRLANSVGVLDADYRGELKVKLAADGYDYLINPGERIAQVMILPIPTISFVEATELTATERGSGGFGSSGQ